MRLRVNNDAGLASPGYNTDPHFGEIVMDDATGIALTTPTTAAKLAAATVLLAGQSFGLTTTGGTTGTHVIVRPGLYLMGFNVDTITGVNSQTVTIEIFKNGATLGTGRALSSTFIQPATAVAIPTMAAAGIASLAVGDTIALYGKADTGNLTVKKMRLWIVQLTDQAVTPTT